VLLSDDDAPSSLELMRYATVTPKNDHGGARNTAWSPATITWDAVHTLLRMLRICNRSSFRQFPSECMFSHENGSEIETVPIAAEFLGSALNIRDNDSSLVYCV
jgi:hypothetical protein